LFLPWNFFHVIFLWSQIFKQGLKEKLKITESKRTGEFHPSALTELDVSPSPEHRSLAILDNYHLPRKNASYHLVILRGHLWGERFQMAVIGERQFYGGNGRNLSGQVRMDMGAFWLSDKFRIRAGIERQFH